MSEEGPYDLVVVGTGFASSFFLRGYLKYAAPNARVLVLERGERKPHSWHVAQRDQVWAQYQGTYTNKTPQKPWVFNISFGGSSNCWWGCTPRMLPEDFELKSRYGVGLDWPISYSELEPYYDETERVMAISGPDYMGLYPRSRPFPQPPHVFSKPDKLLKSAFPDRFFNMPTARPSQTVEGSGRPKCCASSVCRGCPIDSKFTVLNEMAHLYDDPRVTVRIGAEADRLDIAGGRVTGLVYKMNGEDHAVRGDFFALGANAIFNPYILMRSGVQHAELGMGLFEQISVNVDVYLDNLENFQGSTSLTGHGYMFYGGDHRKNHAAALMESSNTPALRDERGKWRHYLRLKFIYEDLRQSENRVTIDQDANRPKVVFEGHSEYAKRGVEAMKGQVETVLAALPVERYRIRPEPEPTESHVMGACIMGRDPATSVVDDTLIHHQLRNLAVLGSGAFPTAAPANPTLTLSALSVRAAERVFRPGAA